MKTYTVFWMEDNSFTSVRQCDVPAKDEEDAIAGAYEWWAEEEGVEAASAYFEAEEKLD